METQSVSSKVVWKNDGQHQYESAIVLTLTVPDVLLLHLCLEYNPRSECGALNYQKV